MSIPQAAKHHNRHFSEVTSVHVERAIPDLGTNASSLTQVQVATLFGTSTAFSQAASFQAAANLPTPKDIFPRPAKLGGRSPVPMEETTNVSADSLSLPQIARSLPNVTLPPLFVTPCHSTSEPPRITPFAFPFRESEFGIREVSNWQFKFKTEVCGGSCYPSDAMWIREIQAAQHFDDMMTSHSITEKPFPNFEMDAKIATALRKIVTWQVPRKCC